MDDTFNQNELSEEDLAVLRAFDAMDLGAWEVENPETSTPNSTDTLTHPTPIQALLGEQDAGYSAAARKEQNLGGQPALGDTLSPDDMLALFISEVDEDMSTIQQTLHQLEPDDQLDIAHLQTLQRTAHKIKGTAASIGCTAIPAIAFHLEELIKLIRDGTVVPLIGLNALVQTVHALELTLSSFVTYDQENTIHLAELEEEYKALNIDIQSGSVSKYLTRDEGHAPVRRAFKAAEPSHPLFPSSGEAGVLLPGEQGQQSSASLPAHQAGSPSRMQGGASAHAGRKEAVPFARIELHRLERLMLHTGQLAELSAPLENAQEEVEKALQELYMAQARLRYLETLLSTPLATKLSKLMLGQAGNGERPTSSLVARILDEAAERTGHSYQRPGPMPSLSLSPGQEADALLSLSSRDSSLPGGQPSTSGQAGRKENESLRWDALEIDRFTESDVLIHSFNEAIADVITASSQVHIAFAQLSRITQKHIDQAASVRNDTLLLRLAPVSTLIPRIERAVAMSSLAQQRRVQFEVEGAATEIDQEILEELKQPLLQLVRTCVAHSFTALSQPAEQVEQGENAGYTDHPARLWLHVRATGNEVTIEVGFSMAVGGSGLDEVQEAIRRLNGSISARRNPLGGISFYLRLPRSQGSIHGLLVRVGSHQVVVPFSHIQRINDGKEFPPQERGTDSSPAESLANLNSLLGFPSAPPSTTIRPVLILQPGLTSQAVQVDEVLGDVKLVVKPLAPHLRRQGITGAAIDGMGNVLLMVDLPELLRRQEMRQPPAEATERDEKHFPGQTQKSILIADDSVYIRQSLLQTLRSAGYRVATARDGKEALDLLSANPPHVLLLDLEMPILNGYDLLSIIRLHPELAQVKIAMLTSRSSEKHQERARELGAHAYLTKPCPQETLLETISSLLAH